MFSMLCKCCELTAKEDFDTYQTELKIDKMLSRGKKLQKLIHQKQDISNTKQIPSSYEPTKDYTRNSSCDKQIRSSILKKENQSSADGSQRNIGCEEESVKIERLFTNDQSASMSNKPELYAFKEIMKAGNMEEFYIDFTASNVATDKLSHKKDSLDFAFKIDKKHIREDERNLRFTKRGILLFINQELRHIIESKSLYIYNKEFQYKHLKLRAQDNTYYVQFEVSFPINIKSEDINSFMSRLYDILTISALRRVWERQTLECSVLESYSTYYLLKSNYIVHQSSKVEITEKVLDFSFDNANYIFMSSIKESELSQLKLKLDYKIVKYSISDCVCMTFLAKTNIEELIDPVDSLTNMKKLYQLLTTI